MARRKTFNDILTDQVTFMHYDALGRMSEQDRFVSEVSQDGGGINRNSVVSMRGVRYNMFDQQLGYDQISVDNTGILIGGSSY